MKEFVKKLIGRLEESEERYDDVSFAQLNEFGRTLDYEYAKGKRDGVAEAIEIVNQLAEEYKEQNIDQDLMIVASLPSLYPMMQPFEVEAINRVVSRAKDSGGWIPTTERLPEKNAIVLTCDKDGWISVKVNMPYAGVKNDFECGYYVAWMPLPEPFKPIAE